MKAILPKKVTPTTIKLDPKKEIPIMGVKIVEEQYAQAFAQNGVIHFSNPNTWRDPNMCSGKQLDRDDGCFCFTTGNNDSIFAKRGRKFIKESSKEGWKYFEDRANIVGVCFYGVLQSDFHDGVVQYGVKNIPSKQAKVGIKYFDDFKDEEKTYKAILIFDFYKFREMIINKIMNMGVAREEIFESTVYYVNKKIPFGTMEPFPFEYFLKDKDFEEQAEFRIIIASKNETFYKQLQQNENNISIGDISSITSVQDYYGTDLEFSIQGNELLYNLATPIETSTDDLSFSELVVELYQIQQNQLPGEPKGKDELDALAKPIIEHLKIRYGVEYRDDWRLYNVPYKEYLTLPDIYKGLCETISE